MSLARDFCIEYGLTYRGTDEPRQDVMDAINATLERAAQEADNYAKNVCNDMEPGQHAKSACGFVASRIRALKGEPT